MRVVLAILLSIVSVAALPSAVAAQEVPNGPNLMKLQPGQVGADSVRIRVQHDPAMFQADSWRISSVVPGVASSATTYECEWGAEGAPGAIAGLFNCDVRNLADGNHSLTLEAKNIGRDTYSANTFLWHTAGPATGIIDPDLPGTFATTGSAGSWASPDVAAAMAGPQRVDASWAGYTPSAPQFPVIGYVVQVTTPNGASEFVTYDEALQLFLNASTHGTANISVYPATTRGLINDPVDTSLAVPNQVSTFTNALDLNQLVGAADFNIATDPQLLRYYVAYFDRQPDLDGAKYWLGIRRLNYTSAQIAGFMAGSEEFQNTYAGTTDREYLTQIYRNVLGRDFDQAGFDYWLDLLQGTNVSGENAGLAQISRSQVVFFVAQSVEFSSLHPFAP